MASSGPPKRPPPPKAASCPSHIGKQVNFSVDVNDLEAAKIRWFYFESGGKWWTPFSGYDSLLLEDARMRVKDSDGDKDTYLEVSVMGDMYTVDVFKKKASIKPVYWDLKEPWPVRRGTWFELSKDRWLPLPEDEADIIEEAHKRKDWRTKARADAELSAWAKTTGSVTNNPQTQQNVVILHQVMLKSYEVVWVGDNDVLKIKKDITSRVLGIVGEKLGKGLSYGSMRIMRGYKEPSLYSDCLPKIGHLVFVIHGIGQAMDSSNIVKSTADLRETCTQVAKKHFPDKWKHRRVEFIPIEWRTWLTLDRGTLRSITLHNVKSLRSMINESVLDIMYYMSPRFGPEILDGFGWQLNKKFKTFTTHHPDFLKEGGTVSLFGHSLGSVMCYDLMCETCEVRGLLDKRDSLPKIQKSFREDDEDETDGATPDSLLEEQFEELHRARIKVIDLEEKLVKKRTLNFNVDHFFAVGSPLGIFVMLKEHENLVKKHFKGAQSFLPSCVCSRIHNLHHPSDPVAYRIEPLINPLYSQIKPVKVDSAGGKPSQKCKDLAEGPRPEETSPTVSRGWFGMMASSVIKGLGSAPSDEPTQLPENKIYDDDSKLKPEERLQERLDFMLRESFTENSYLNAITAHLCYWTNSDTALYILLQIYTYQKTGLHKATL